MLGNDWRRLNNKKEKKEDEQMKRMEMLYYEYSFFIPTLHLPRSLALPQGRVIVPAYQCHFHSECWKRVDKLRQVRVDTRHWEGARQAPAAHLRSAPLLPDS